MMSKKFVLSASVLALVASATMVQADAMADLEAAAKAEGNLTVIALPASWWYRSDPWKPPASRPRSRGAPRSRGN